MNHNPLRRTLKYIIIIEGNEQLTKIDIKNCTYYHFYDIIKMKDFDFDILLGKKIIRKYFNL